MSREEQEKKNKQAGMLVTVGVHLAVILLFVFLVAWRAPDPPLPEFGIELNFGTSDQGTGDIQPETPPAVSETEDEAAPDAPEEVVEEVEETSPVQEETIETPPDVTETNNVEETITPVTTQETEAPVKEPETKPVEEKPVVEEPKKEEPKPQPPKVLYPGNNSGAGGTTGNSQNPTNANQGDKTGAVGDQGNPEGSVDARALYGELGGGGGSTLEMAGWKWDNAPNPNDNTSESGRIEFKVIIDERGEVVSVTPINYTVSASLMRLYREEVAKLTFSQTSTGKAPPQTEGKITFLIKAK